MEKSSTTPHAVLVSSPGMGHLNPFLALANRLASLHSFKVTVIYVNSSNAAIRAGGEQHSDVNLVNIQAADISNKVGPGAHLVSRICILMRETASSIRAAISGLRPTILVLGIFGTEYLCVAREMGVPAFVFINSAGLLALTVYCPVLDKEVEGEYVDQTHPLVLSGELQVRPEDVVDPMVKRSEPQYAEYLRIGVQFPLFDGVIVTTWQDLEGPTLAALRKPGSILPIPVYDIGPTTAVMEPQYGSSTTKDETMLMEWLDRQPAQSVIYISFGSGGTLSVDQTKELALGLELSQQRFVWVVRPPTDGDACGAYFGLKKGGVDSNDSSLYLPEGFKERTRDLGWLVHQWAPQSKVLAHPSVGGFLTHCGWSSMMESLTNGVPMMTWPMFADQRLQATFLVEQLEVAIRASELPAEKLVQREEIGRKVRELLLEGALLRLRAQELKSSAAQSLTPTGSSTNRLSQFVQTVIPHTSS